MEPAQMARMSPAGLARFDTKGVWKPYGYLLALNRLLLMVASQPRRQILRVIVNFPPRHGKSTLVSQYFPAWYTGLFPDHRVLFGSYEGNFAASWGLKARDVATRCGYLFNLQVRRDISAASHWQYKDHEGGMSTAGVGGAFTGKGAHILIVDDPVKNDKEARSKARREEVFEWFRSTATTRLEPGGAVILIMTRWHDGDLAGRLVREQPGTWEVFSLPAIAKAGDPMGRAEGAALCPERFPAEALQQIKTAIGSYWWAALYDQDPRIEGGNIFLTSWFHRYRLTQEMPGKLVKRIHVYDTAHKEKKTNDFSTCTEMELRNIDTGPAVFITWAWREKVQYPDLKKKFATFYQNRKPHEVVIEDKDAGAMLIQELRRGTSLPIIAIQADRDKTARGHAASPVAEAGKVWIPHEDDTPWVKPWLDEVTGFPNMDYDDWYDGLCHGLQRLKGPQGPGFFFLGMDTPGTTGLMDSVPVPDPDQEDKARYGSVGLPLIV